MTHVSFVVITYNEEENISDCIGSIHDLVANSSVGNYEILVVDSNSTDKTVDRVISFDKVRVIKLPTGYESPAAGRYVGTEVSHGDVLVFVDGDMILQSGWLDDALAEMAPDDVAGVCGCLNEKDIYSVEETAKIKGVMLYKKAVFDTRGGFDPFIRGGEDYELSFRLNAEGYRTLKLPTVVATHQSKDKTVMEIPRRVRHGYYASLGQLLRKNVTRPGLAAEHIKRNLANLVLPPIYVLLGVVFLQGSKITKLSIIGAATLALGYGTTKSGFHRTCYYFASKPVKFICVVHGGLRSHPQIEHFPLHEVKIVDR